MKKTDVFSPDTFMALYVFLIFDETYKTEGFIPFTLMRLFPYFSIYVKNFFSDVHQDIFWHSAIEADCS